MSVICSLKNYSLHITVRLLILVWSLMMWLVVLCGEVLMSPCSADTQLKQMVALYLLAPGTNNCKLGTKGHFFFFLFHIILCFRVHYNTPGVVVNHVNFWICCYQGNHSRNDTWINKLLSNAATGVTRITCHMVLLVSIRSSFYLSEAKLLRLPEA